MAMRKWTINGAQWAVGFALTTLPTAGAALDEWQIDATNRAQTEYYSNSGVETASPYPIDGLHSYDEANVNLNRRLSPYERLSVSFNAVVNDSFYRGSDQGGTLERARLFWEKGDGPIPLRLEAGDFYAYQSTRTIQTSLKGVQAEVQPSLGGARHSLQAFAGQQAASYSDFDSAQPRYAGASWLMEHRSFGAVSLNSSFGRQTLANADVRDQQVVSLAHTVPFSIGSEDLSVESEFAHLQDDTEGRLESDKGYFLELSGRSRGLPLTYSASYSLYGPDYQPFGASVAADQRAVETYATLRFQSGRFLRGRVLDYRDGVEAANPTDSRTTGLTLGGSLFSVGGMNITGNLDGFVTEREDDNDTLHTRDSNLNASFSVPISSNVSTRVQLLGQIRDDRLAGTTRYLRQANVSLDYRFQVWSIRGSLSPGVLYRETAGDSTDSRDLNPTVSGFLRTGDHSLRFSYNSLRQEVREPRESDFLTQRATLQYGYQYQQHRFGLEGQYYDRHPQGTGNTYASRVGLFWEYRFSKTASQARAAPAIVSGSQHDIGITSFTPGENASQITGTLAAQGLGAPRKDGDLLIYEAPVFAGVQRRQRLAYEVAGNSLRSTNLVIDLNAVGDGRSSERTFNDVLGTLIRRYGTPELQISQGDFGAGLAGRLNTGQFARTYQWQLDGNLLRFGIPSRIDGQVRMELRYAADLPPAEQNDWSLSDFL